MSIISRGLICPIYKAGSRTDPSNYRGISLLNCIGKIFTAILNNTLSEWVEGNNLLPEEQFGFRKNRRAVDCVYILNTVIEKARAEFSPLYICYVDLKKAFGNVCHYLLWMKLRSLGISGKFLRILISMYTKASARVKLSSQQATEPFACQKGVRQGCKLSPLLFSLFISGLEIELARNKAGVEVHDNHLDVLMFADDIVMFSTSPMGLQKQLDTLEQFCCRWKLKINNIDKTKICVYGSAKEQSFTCYGTHLDNADSWVSGYQGMRSFLKRESI